MPACRLAAHDLACRRGDRLLFRNLSFAVESGGALHLAGPNGVGKSSLGERFHASPKLLQRLNPGAAFDKAGQQIMVPNVISDARLPAAARIEVDKSDRAVRAFDVQGKLLGFYPATIGSERDPLPIGEWKINLARREPWFHYNPKLFWDADPSHSKAKIAPGPNNPVGVVWIDLSKEHYGIHGTPEPSTIGKTASHGCIRLTNWDAAELTGMIGPGTPVLLKE